MTRIAAFLKHNAIALTALFIALGGTSYAALAIPRNSVGARQLRKGAVTATKLHAGAVTPGKLSGKAFGGRILDIAEINPIGRVLLSEPKGVQVKGWSLTSNGGLLTWPHQHTPKNCFPLAGASAALPNTATSTGPPTASAQLEGSGKPTQLQVATSGEPSVTVLLVCAP